MKYYMKNYFAYLGAIGMFAIWAFCMFVGKPTFDGIIAFSIVLVVGEFVFLFGIFRSYVILAPRGILIYAGILKRAIFYEEIDFIKETSNMFLISHPYCYWIHNLGIRIKGPNIYGMDYVLVSLQELDAFLYEIEINQPRIKVIRK